MSERSYHGATSSVKKATTTDQLTALSEDDESLDAESIQFEGARCSSVVRAFAHGAMDHRIDPSSGGPIELFLVPPSAPRLV